MLTGAGGAELARSGRFSQPTGLAPNPKVPPKHHHEL
jgi:hypothetical protein